MTRTPRLRRPAPLVAAASAAALLGALLPVALPAALTAPAHAEAGCLTEAPQGGGIPILQPGTRCDDSTPPQTVFKAMTPAPDPTSDFLNAATTPADKKVSFDFGFEYTDADADPVTFRCRFNGGTREADGQWAACNPGVSYTLKGDTRPGTEFTFEVYAIDSADSAIDATTPTDNLTGSGGAETDLPAPQSSFGEGTGAGDRDQTPASFSFQVDTKIPQASIFTSYYDPESPELPMITDKDPEFRLVVSEPGATLTCASDGRPVACSPGLTTFTGLGAGTKTLSVFATDAAGNVDPDPDTVRFTLPADIALAGTKGWKQFSSPKAFGGSYLETTKLGAKFSVKGEDVREVRLLCTTRPDGGMLKYKLPGGVWQKVKTSSKDVDRNAVVIIRTNRARPFTGTMRFETFSAGKPVAVDGIMLR